MDVLGPVKTLFVKSKEVNSDNNIFKLHYRITVIILIVFSILLSSKQYFGGPIDCDVKERKETIDTYCWIFGTYIIKNTLRDKTLAGLGPDPQITPYWMRKSQNSGNEINWQNYYQWVCVMLWLQALFFYTPKYLWKLWECRRLKTLVENLTNPLHNPSTWNTQTKENLVEYLLCRKHPHNLYAVRFTICEVLNFFNVILQIYIIDWFLTGHFSLYGLNYIISTDLNPMNEIFPKLTKCTYYKFGPSGSKEIRDALCVLPLNVLNEKLFLLLWFWFAALMILTFFSLIYRALVILSPRLRVYLLMAKARTLNIQQAKSIIRKLTYGDFFVLYQMGKNLNPIIYQDLVVAIYEHIAKCKTSVKCYADSAINNDA